MNTQQTKIMIIDDDVELCYLMKTYLEQQGFIVCLSHDGSIAEVQIEKNAPDLIVLDLMLPGIDGLSICRAIRQTCTAPILMFTALNEEIDEVVGLETGADDYLKKPVSPRLLLARVRALLRRSDVLQGDKEAPGQLVSEGELILNLQARQAMIDGKTLDLSTVEYDLLALLVSKAGTILTRQELYQSMRSLDYDGLDRSVDMYISRLRKKLGDDPRLPKLIKTVRGSGYLFCKQLSF